MKQKTAYRPSPVSEAAEQLFDTYRYTVTSGSTITVISGVIVLTIGLARGRAMWQMAALCQIADACRGVTSPRLCTHGDDSNPSMVHMYARCSYGGHPLMVRTIIPAYALSSLPKEGGR